MSERSLSISSNGNQMETTKKRKKEKVFLNIFCHIIKSPNRKTWNACVYESVETSRLEMEKKLSNYRLLVTHNNSKKGKRSLDVTFFYEWMEQENVKNQIRWNNERRLEDEREDFETVTSSISILIINSFTFCYFNSIFKLTYYLLKRLIRLMEAWDKLGS